MGGGGGDSLLTTFPLPVVANSMFIEKVLQFHETLKVRFGVMVVGPTMGGKSKVIDILRQSYC